jgi:hypothetical protein
MTRIHETEQFYQTHATAISQVVSAISISSLAEGRQIAENEAGGHCTRTASITKQPSGCSGPLRHGARCSLFPSDENDFERHHYGEGAGQGVITTKDGSHSSRNPVLVSRIDLIRVGGEE